MDKPKVTMPPEVRDEFAQLVDTAVEKIGDAIDKMPIIVVVQANLKVLARAANQIPDSDIKLAMARSLKDIADNIIADMEATRH